MGNELPWQPLSTKGRRRVVQQHEKWHYNTEVLGFTLQVDQQVWTQDGGIKVKMSDEAQSHLFTIKTEVLLRNLSLPLLFAFVCITGELLCKFNSSGTIVCNH